MKRPWQIWSAYAAALIVAAAAFAGVTWRALQADRAEREVRNQAAVEENVRLALWRMDSAIVPLVAQESARPTVAYLALIMRANFGRDAAGKLRAGKVETPPFPQVPFPDETRGYFHVTGGKEGRIEFAAPPQNERKNGAGAPETAGENSGNRSLPKPLHSVLNYETLLAELPAPTDRDPTAIALEPTNPRNGYLNTTDPANGKPVFNSTAPEEGILLGRGRQEYQARAQFLQNSTTNNRNNDNAEWLLPPRPENVKTGSLRPLVVRNELLLARQAVINGQTHILGCWLDWNSIRARLMADIADLLPQARLTLAADVPEDRQSRRLASLPVQLELAAVAPVGDSISAPLRMSLGVAWGSLVMAAVAVALLLRGVLALSERRASFVSAVTHELRTPLTTFRMYAEMLAEGMVPDETARRKYLDTLRVEADRLSHLVENVLAYARLERGGLGNRIRSVTVGEVLDTAVSRARDRACQAGFEIEVEASEGARNATALADPSAVEQIVFNLVDNAAKYASSATDRRIHLQVEAADRRLLLRVRDHGPGISISEQQRLFEPFRKSASDAAASAPGVGLGLALSRRLARDMGGDLLWDAHVVEGAGFVLILKRGTDSTAAPAQKNL